MFLSRLLKKSKASSEASEQIPADPCPLPTQAGTHTAPLSALKPLENDMLNANQTAAVPNETAPAAEDVQIYVQPTPNPHAFKFIVSKDVKTTGTATYEDPDATDNDLARSLLSLPGVQQVYFFDNVITLTFNPTVPFNILRERVYETIREKLPAHDANYKTETDKKQESYDNLPADVKRINEILDHTVRPGLQGDGGNIEVLSYVDHQLSVRYQGACGSCPSSLMGTLQAITQILRDEFDPEIEVIPV